MINKFINKHKNEIDLFNSGNSFKSYKFLGVHKFMDGYIFSVWAPNADTVSLCGDFNSWNTKTHIMEKHNGIWYLFAKDVSEEYVYKYAITKNKNTILKSDPYAFYSELRPGNASLVKTISDFKYEKLKTNKNIFKSPVNIYEVHLGSFITEKDGSFCNYRKVAPKLSNYLLEMGYNFVELLPVCEHPLDTSWGYQTTGYYSVTSRYGTPEDFQYFVGFLHKMGIGVIIDWVPGHFCRDEHGLYRFDGTSLYENNNNQLADNPGWGTCNFDFNKPQVRSFLISNAVFWMEYYNIDGLRVDAVANIIFNDFCKERSDKIKNEQGDFRNLKGIEFIKQLNNTINKLYPDNIMCAEDSSDFENVTKSTENGGLGFHFKWNMGWMNDTLSYIKLDPIYKKYMHNNLTFLMHYAFNENFILPISHDEVVHGKCSLFEKMPGYRKDKFAQVKSFMIYMYGMPGKKLSFMGNEFAQPLEWRFYEQVEWELLKYKEYAEVKYAISEINHIYLDHKAMWENDNSWDGFRWCDANDRDKSILSFARMSDDKNDVLVFIINFTPVKYEKMAIGVPYFSEYKEIFTTDNVIYGGGNNLNRGVILPRSTSQGEQNYSVNITVPPYTGIILEKI